MLISTFAITVAGLTTRCAGHDLVVLQELDDLEATEIRPVPPIFKAWWDSTAECLHVRADWDPSVRFFQSGHIPNSMVARSDHGKTFKGYADPAARFIVLAPGTVKRDVLTHEVWHLHFGTGHPREVFSPPRCGMSRP